MPPKEWEQSGTWINLADPVLICTDSRGLPNCPGFIQDNFAFYKRANAGYAMVQTGERRLYGNIILKKGVIRPGE